MDNEIKELERRVKRLRLEREEQQLRAKVGRDPRFRRAGDHGLGRAGPRWEGARLAPVKLACSKEKMHHHREWILLLSGYLPGRDRHRRID
ncbi:hypothetical protein LJR130_003031 [Variovorax sp. LjRoot130]|uniref:hypothetical protein n=1 Tax=Variovorax sp. LjRoot130 TaxID=3342261 RepID=UPI003ECFB999